MMAKVSYGVFQTFKAAADYSDRQFAPVYISSADTVTITGASGKVNGILLNKPKTGEAAQVCTASGVLSKLAVDATTDIAPGDPLEADAASKGVKFTINGAGTTGTYLIGWANEAATESSAIITILTNFAPTSK